MDLKTVFSAISTKLGQKEQKLELHLAVKISTTSVTSTVWSVEDGKVTIGKVGSSAVPKNASWEQFLKSVDEAVSGCTADLQQEVTKTVFAVPLDWVTDGKIGEEHLKDLRRLCKELDFVPVGYVVLTEALENFFKEVEGAPLTGIVVGVDGDRSALTMYRAGKNLGTVPLGTEEGEEFSESIEKALKRFSEMEIFPSRFILYDGKTDLEPLAAKLTAYPWTKNLPFLHVPKVETLSAEFVVKAVAVASGMQMGGMFDLGTDAEMLKVEESVKKNIPSEPEIQSDMSPTDADVKAEDAVESIDQNNNPVELEEVSAEEAGFTSGEEINEVAIPLPHDPVQVLQDMEQPTKTDSHQNSFSAKPAFNLATILAKVKYSAASLLSKIPSVKIKREIIADERKFMNDQLPSGKKVPNLKIIAAAVGAVVLILLFAFVVLFIPKVHLIVAIDTKEFNHDLEVIVAAQKEATAGAKSIPGSFVEVSEVGTKKGVATGSKLVGDKAKGTVTIYSVSSSHSFTAGTSVSSPDGLKFTLDRDVTVASGDAVTPATVSVAATAGDIGDKYNLAGGTKFTIGSLPSTQYLAKNEGAFSGGNSHQATVVTKADQDRLLAALTSELADKAKSALSDKVPQGQTLLPTAVSGVASKTRFSKDVDSEADTFSLDLTMDFKGAVFSQQEMLSLFKSNFSSDIPSGFDLSPDAAINITNPRLDKSGNFLLNANVSGKLTPQVDLQDLAKKVSGKGSGAVRQILSTVPGFSDFTKETKPGFLNFATNLMLPVKSDNITVEIVAK